jgi:DNA-directed RNA polymerase specialized sigma24 family protein
MSDKADFDRLMADVASGSEEAVMQFAETFTPHIIRSVRRCMSPKIRQKLDSDDVVQTLWASLLLHPDNLLRLKTREQMIAFLAKATRNKVAEKAARLRTQKRDVNREERLDEQRLPNEKIRNRIDFEPRSRELTPSTNVSLREKWRTTMANATERDRQIIALVVQRHTYLEIAEILSIHEQTARRVVERIVNAFSD